MPNKVLNSSKSSSEDKVKAETTTVKGTVTMQQKDVIRSLIGALGSNEQDVVGKIITIWLYNEGYLKDIVNSTK